MCDFFIDKILTDDELVFGFSRLMNVPPEKILVAASSLHEYDVLCKNHIHLFKTIKAGEFPMCLSVYHPIEFGPKEFIERISDFCVQMNCSFLTSGDSIDPYIWMLIDNKGKKYLADLDVDKLNDDLEIKVRRVKQII